MHETVGEWDTEPRGVCARLRPVEARRRRTGDGSETRPCPILGRSAGTRRFRAPQAGQPQQGKYPGAAPPRRRARERRRSPDRPRPRRS